MDIDETRKINAIALHNLARLIGISGDDIDVHIERMRDEFSKHEKLKISEAIPKIMVNKGIDDIMSGAIMAIFISDFYFNEYMNGEL